ncbi:MAG: truB [Rickettsiaceae bacterium]|jgi:tRNA pseudouridine55 synthase|nr:truB [Rickettsiaceae bacterium]
MSKPEAINGNFWLNIDKPEGYSSAKVVAIVKRITKSKKVGHAGTLDPFATGVLPIAIGKATKTCSYVVDGVKKYYFEITWGEFRDSDDKTGNVTKSNDLRPETQSIINALPYFIGKISQIPSRFSAIKIEGKKSYQLAREGIEVEMKPRMVTINKIRLVFNNQDKAGFEVTCSKGTYIRSLARDLSAKIGVCGYVSVLRRLQVGNFLIKDVILLDNLKNILNYNAPSNLLLPLRDVLNFIPEIELNNFDASKIKAGQSIKLEDFSQKTLTVKIINNDQLVALANLEEGFLKVINNF